MGCYKHPFLHFFTTLADVLQFHNCILLPVILYVSSIKMADKSFMFIIQLKFFSGKRLFFHIICLLIITLLWQRNVFTRYSCVFFLSYFSSISLVTKPEAFRTDMVKLIYCSIKRLSDNLRRDKQLLSPKRLRHCYPGGHRFISLIIDAP